MRETRAAGKEGSSQSNEVRRLGKELREALAEVRRLQKRCRARRRKYLAENERLGNLCDEHRAAAVRAQEQLTNYLRKEGACTRDSCIEEKMLRKQAEAEVERVTQWKATR